jgi:hypothetical protein
MSYTPVRGGDSLIGTKGNIKLYLRIEPDGHTEFCLKTRGGGDVEVVSWNKRARPDWASSEEVVAPMPRWLFGEYPEVLRQSRRRAAMLATGASLADVAGGEWIDPRQEPGQIVIGRAVSLIARSIPQYHVDLLWNSVERRYWPDQVELCEQISSSMLEAPWGLLSILYQNYNTVRRASQQLHLIAVAAQYWGQLLPLGPRFSTGGWGCQYLEEIPTLLQFSLARQGVPGEALRQPLTSELLAQLVSSTPGFQIRAFSQEGRLEQAADLIRHHRDEIVFLSLSEHLVDFGHDAFACDLVRSVHFPDPHGIAGAWLAKQGDPSRTVQRTWSTK